jgi:hypothetical protein
MVPAAGRPVTGVRGWAHELPGISSSSVPSRSRVASEVWPRAARRFSVRFHSPRSPAVFARRPAATASPSAAGASTRREARTTCCCSPSPAGRSPRGGLRGSAPRGRRRRGACLPAVDAHRALPEEHYTEQVEGGFELATPCPGRIRACSGRDACCAARRIAARSRSSIVASCASPRRLRACAEGRRELRGRAQYLHSPAWKGKSSATAVVFDT